MPLTPLTVTNPNDPLAASVPGINAQVESINKGLASQSPTVLTNTGIIEKKIPQLMSDADKIAPPQNPDQPASEPDPTETYLKSLYGDSGDQTDPSYALEDQLISSLQKSSDLSTNAYIDSIRKQYEGDKQTLQEQQAGNRASSTSALLRSGTSRYAPTVAGGLLSQENRADLRELGKLQANENVQIAQVQQAKQTQDYQLLDRKLTQLKEIRAQKQDVAKAIYDAMQKKKEQDQKDVNDVLKSLAKNGAPNDVVSAVQNARNLGEAVAQAGDYLQEGSGTVGEYLYYKRDALARGQQPLSYNEYADMDANRKRSIVNNYAGGLSNTQLTKATTIADQFKNEQTVKDYQVIGQNLSAYKSLGDSPADDIQRVYTFAKTMDPNSAVREGEYKTVQQYAQAYLPSLGIKGIRLVDNRGFLTKQARDLMEKSLEKKFAPVEKNYSSIRDSYAQRINKVTGNTDGGEFITDYSLPPDPLAAENNAQKTVITYGTQHPEAQAHIRQLAGVIQPDKGRAYTWEEIAQIIGAQ